MPFSPAVRELFNSWKHLDLLVRLEASHRHLIERRKNAVEFPCPDELRQRTVSNCLVVQQVQLHRAERLVAGTGTMKPTCMGLLLLFAGTTKRPPFSGMSVTD